MKLNDAQKLRSKIVLKKAGILLLVGVIYLVWLLITGIGIPCIFYTLSGKYCPGCGITRMFVAMAKLDFEKAFFHNVFVFSLLPFVCIFSVAGIIKYIKIGKTELSFPMKIIYIILAVLCIVFWILRNTERFSILAP